MLIQIGGEKRQQRTRPNVGIALFKTQNQMVYRMLVKQGADGELIAFGQRQAITANGLVHRQWQGAGAAAVLVERQIGAAGLTDKVVCAGTAQGAKMGQKVIEVARKIHM